MAAAHPNILDSRTPYASPTPSRPTSPVPIHSLRRYAHLHSSVEDLDPYNSQSRSRSRARPGRKLSEDVQSQAGRASNRSDIRRTRFASPANDSIHKDLGATIHSQDVLPSEENARIWQIYMDEATKADTAMLEGWNRSLDVLLVFTGLFSAVLTTFIIQSYQVMIPDPADDTNALLSELILLQFNNTDNAPRARQILDAKETSSRQIHWVNGLWFAALSCSLSNALISMLAKQWLQTYPPIASGTLRFRARRRHARYLHLEIWHVPAIINALPMMLHIALLLFFAGLILLLWPEDIGITGVTWAIVALSYSFYLISVGLPLIYPDCPYHHPVSDHIRKWLSPKPSSPKWCPLPKGVYSSNTHKSPEELQDEDLDAAALIWLFTTSTDNDVVSAALQAIAGLPRDFSAIGRLREAGALHLVVQGFESCFHKDTTVDLQWHLIDPEGATLFCKAWINLTRETSERWPFDIVEPLWSLQDLKGYPEAAAIASCAVALSSFDSHMSQWELLSFLARCASGELSLTQAIQSCLLDSFVECIVRWEMPAAVIDQTNVRAVPTLLRMLHLTEELPGSELRSAAALALYVITSGPVDLSQYRSERKRRSDFCELLIQGLSVITNNPERFGVKDDLVGIAARELCRLAPPIVAQSERFPQPLKRMAQSSLSRLYVDNHIGVGIIPDTLLADVLHLLFPPVLVPETQRPALVSLLVENLQTSSHPEITGWSIRLLEHLMWGCRPPILDAFAESKGIHAVLRAAKAGREDSRRLQIDSLRTLCTFINSATKHCMDDEKGTLDPLIDSIFDSDFFETICSFIGTRRWWLYEISGDWMPALVRLCTLRPDKPVWPLVVKVFGQFTNRNNGEDGYRETIRQLDDLKRIAGIEVENDIARW
ncbi:hypothetical protein VNI00_007380 [Paramarasmius palmivorus]|uniref:DUF6535 domain-containing protein n=1 Tax=Paramarasmius palmivorus TaxID=297713 RepID=A0AAW0CZY1_9AGAR